MSCHISRKELIQSRSLGMFCVRWKVRIPEDLRTLVHIAGEVPTSTLFPLIKISDEKIVVVVTHTVVVAAGNAVSAVFPAVTAAAIVDW